MTYEFDRWMSGSGSHGDRLDLLGLDEDGRLVLAELKRDGAPDTVEMQAIKYAAYASRFKVETLAACHADYLRRTLGAPVTLKTTRWRNSTSTAGGWIRSSSLQCASSSSPALSQSR